MVVWHVREIARWERRESNLRLAIAHGVERTSLCRSGDRVPVEADRLIRQA